MKWDRGCDVIWSHAFCDEFCKLQALNPLQIYASSGCSIVAAFMQIAIPYVLQLLLLTTVLPSIGSSTKRAGQEPHMHETGLPCPMRVWPLSHVICAASNGSLPTSPTSHAVLPCSTNILSLWCSFSRFQLFYNDWSAVPDLSSPWGEAFCIYIFAEEHLIMPTYCLLKLYWPWSSFQYKWYAAIEFQVPLNISFEDRCCWLLIVQRIHDTRCVHASLKVANVQSAFPAKC